MVVLKVLTITIDRSQFVCRFLIVNCLQSREFKLKSNYLGQSQTIAVKTQFRTVRKLEGRNLFRCPVEPTIQTLQGETIQRNQQALKLIPDLTFRRKDSGIRDSKGTSTLKLLTLRTLQRPVRNAVATLCSTMRTQRS